MGLESSFNFIDDLNSAWPLGSDAPSTLDNHDRGIKSAVQGSLPNLGSTAVTASAVELNIMDGVTATTAELNIMDGVTKTTDELNASSALVQGTPVATTSGTTADVTSIPTWVKRITVTFDKISSDFASETFSLVIGDSGGLELTGYESGISTLTTVIATAGSSTSLLIARPGTAAQTFSGSAVLVNVTGNIWECNGSVNYGSNARVSFSSGIKTLSGTLDRFSLQTAFGNFDAGQMNSIYEG